MTRTVLFLCTGNYYRSRFAEELFNHLAARRGLPWTATSRGLDLDLGRWNVGPISPHTRAALAARGIPLADPPRLPAACVDGELSAADLVVAVKEAEHRAYLERKHPGWADRVTYWHVHDLDKSGPDEATGEIADLVGRLVERLATEEPNVEPDPS